MSKRIAVLLGSDHIKKEFETLFTEGWQSFSSPLEINVKDIDGLVILGQAFKDSFKELLEKALEDYVPILATASSLNILTSDEMELAAPLGWEAMKSNYIECPDDDYITDRAHKIVTTPGYHASCNEEKVMAGLAAAKAELLEMS